MVQKTEKFFIFSWKEVMVIALLGVIGVGFFFTLGLHYGKKIHTQAVEVESGTLQESGKLAEGPEVLPTRDSLEQGSRHALIATEDSIKTATLEVLEKDNIRLEAPKQVDLPKEKVIAKAIQKFVKEDKLRPLEEPTQTNSEKSAGKYALQLGSFPSKADAQKKVKAYSNLGIDTEVKIAIVEGVTRYRVVVPGFPTKAVAETKAKTLQQQKKIASFVVIKN